MTYHRLIVPLSALPPLESCDKLTPAKFEQRYAAMFQVKEAELIEGTVYVASPLRAKTHGKPHTHIMTWLGTYDASTPGVAQLMKLPKQSPPIKRPGLIQPHEAVDVVHGNVKGWLTSE